MRQRRHLVWSVLGALALAAVGGAGLVVAEDLDGDGVEDVDADGNGVTDVQRRADLTPAEMLVEAERITRDGTALSHRCAGMLDEARRERDIVRVTCLNDKLTQINASLRTAEDRAENLSEAVEAGDTSRANHEYVVISVLGQRFVVLERDANQCIGQDLWETGAVRVETFIDPDAPTEDPNTYPPLLEFVFPVPYIPSESSVRI